MTEDQYSTFDKHIASIIGIGTLQDSVTLYKLLEENEYTIKDAFNFLDMFLVKTNIEQEKSTKLTPVLKELEDKFPNCPDCDAKLKLKAIKDNNLGYESVWQCYNGDCIYEKYNMETFRYIITDLIGKEKANKLLGEE